MRDEGKGNGRAVLPACQCRGKKGPPRIREGRAFARVCPVRNTQRSGRHLQCTKRANHAAPYMGYGRCNLLQYVGIDPGADARALQFARVMRCKLQQTGAVGWVSVRRWPGRRVGRIVLPRGAAGCAGARKCRSSRPPATPYCLPARDCCHRRTPPATSWR